MGNPYWINIAFPQLGGVVYLSYKTIGGNSVFKIKTPAGYRDSLAKHIESLREKLTK
jgi:hypothetical protein